MNNKVKKANSIEAYADVDFDTGKVLIHCSAKYTVDGDPESGVLVTVYEVPDKLPREEATMYAKDLFVYSLIKKGYIVKDGESTE